MAKDTIRNILQDRIMVLDGAMGTMIQKHPLEEDDFRKGWFEDHDKPLKGNNDLLTLTRPDIIEEIHNQFLEAGADIIETNTFSSTTIAQADYALEDQVYALNKHGAELAKKAAKKYTEKNPDKPRFVAGSLGPTNRTASLSPDVNDPGYRNVTFNSLVEAYSEQTKALIEGGTDILLVETIFDTLNAKAALFAIDQVQEEMETDLPVMVSGTITDASGRTLSGQVTEAFIISVSHAKPLSIGLNCALGAKELRPYLQTMRSKSEFFVSAHPNAGLPNEMGEYDQSPEEMVDQIKVFMDEKLINIIGGCCGTTPEHIEAMAELAAQYEPEVLTNY